MSIETMVLRTYPNYPKRGLGHAPPDLQTKLEPWTPDPESAHYGMDFFFNSVHVVKINLIGLNCGA